MKTVLRYKLNNDALSGGMQSIPMPKGARLLRGGFTGSSISLWALVDVPAPATVQAETLTDQSKVFNVVQEGEVVATPATEQEAIEEAAKRSAPETENREFEVFRTGQPMPPTPGARREYFSSVIEGPLHVHIFEWIAIEEKTV